jgi:DNA-binding MarR family transcriptional regulator
MRAMPDPRTLAETESAMNRHIEGLEIDFAAAHTVSSLYRAANAVRAHITNAVLRQYDLTWSGFVVMWVVWIWDGMETRHVAESAAISKATLTGVMKTLESRGWLIRESSVADRRLVQLRLTQSGADLMTELYPKFNAAESDVVRQLSARSKASLARDLRSIVRTVEANGIPANGVGA